MTKKTITVNYDLEKVIDAAIQKNFQDQLDWVVGDHIVIHKKWGSEGNWKT